MSRHDNYPDDIRKYDDDPRSPFYVDPDAWMDAAIEVLANQWRNELMTTKRIDDLDEDCHDIHIRMKKRNTIDVLDVLHPLASIEVNREPEKYAPASAYESLEWR